jgi:hypothetical protein
VISHRRSWIAQKTTFTGRSASNFSQSAGEIPRGIHEHARDKARDIAKTDAYVVSRRERKKIEMLFAHLKRIIGLEPP